MQGLDGPEAEGAATSAALRKAPDGSSGIVNVDGEQTLVAVRASAGSTTLVMGPGSMKVCCRLRLAASWCCNACSWQMDAESASTSLS